MKSLLCIMFAVAIFAIAGIRNANAQTMHACYVNDPSPPMNLRASPNGRIIGKLRNGTELYFRTQPDGEWALAYRRVRGKYTRAGYVYFNYMNCQGWF
jgi:hypothetical protein